MAIALTLVSFALILWMILTFRRKRSITRRAPLISIGMSLLFILVYWLIVGTSIPVWGLFFIIVTGIVLGVWRGKNTKVWIEKGIAKAQNTIWFLIVWAFCYGLNQFLISAGKALSFNLGMASMAVGTGVILGSQGNIFLRLQKLHPARASGTVATDSSGSASEEPPADRLNHCPQCGAEVSSSERFCTGCGSQL